MENLRKDLEQRGFLHQYTHEKVFDLFEKGGQKFYFGVDCSANSMTIGNFVALMMAIHFMRRSNKCYLLVWWATSTIWNPGWKDTQRPILSKEELTSNQAGITKQFERLVRNVEIIEGTKLDFEIVNNYDFFKNMNVLDFLNEVGRYMTVNWMLGKDIVKKRVTDPDKWISYAEFSYMLIMGYDFYYLHKNHWVTLEVGGSDEWDGILSGIELIGKKLSTEVFGVTNKLITDANGKKFGKSEGNAIWLDETKTSAYALYQYFVNALDQDIEKYLHLFTFLSPTQIQTISDEHNSAPEKRQGQKLLAYKVVEMIHGTYEADFAKNMTQFMFSRSKLATLEKLSMEELMKFQTAMGGCNYISQNLFETIVQSGLAKSNSEARNAVKSWAISINEQKVNDFNYSVVNNFLSNGALLIQKGKKDLKLILK